MIETAFASLTIGLLSSTNPCILPLYPGFLAYTAGGRLALEGSRLRYLLGLAVLAGIMSTQLALGAVIAGLSISVGRILTYLVPLADLILIVLGLLLLLGKNPFLRIPQIRVPKLSHPLLSAFLYGVLYAPLALPCSGPLVVSIFGLSATLGSALNQFAAFFWFGLGMGLPLVAISLAGAAAQKSITQLFARHANLIHRAGGLVLIAVALYDLAMNWQFLFAN